MRHIIQQQCQNNVTDQDTRSNGVTSFMIVRASTRFYLSSGYQTNYYGFPWLFLLFILFWKKFWHFIGHICQYAE